MKKILLLIGFVIIKYQLSIIHAQVPQSMNYQAVARNSTGAPLLNSSVAVRISIHDSTASGTVLYSERDTATTNAFGLFTCNVGTGNVISGVFSTINWATNNKYMQVDLDPTGGSSYTNMGTTQILSVPYSLTAGGIKLQDGTQGAGKVLTSDAAGKGSWADPAVGGQAVMYCMALNGVYPSTGSGCSVNGLTYLGEIRAFPYSFVPCGWQKCDGTLLQINTNQALFSLLGTTYGGNGTSTFAVPDLRGRILKGNQ